jgi:simple sugar transport system permease protein
MNLGAFVPGITAGRGWIALVVIILGNKKPLGLLAAAFIFSFADAFSNYFQGLFSIPADFLLAFPYLCTFLAIIAVSVKSKNRQEMI